MALPDHEWPIGQRVIVKRRETPAMRGRPWAERQAIAAGPLRRALSVTEPAAVAGSRLLVFDDVMTEGSTLQEVGRALLGAGAAEVAGLVLTRPPSPAVARTGDAAILAGWPPRMFVPCLMDSRRSRFPMSAWPWPPPPGRKPDW